MLRLVFTLLAVVSAATCGSTKPLQIVQSPDASNSVVARHSPQAATAEDIVDPDAYDVYRAVIPNDWLVTVARAKRLVIARETATYDRCLPTGPPMLGDWRPVLENYAAENQGGRYLQPDRPIGVTYIVRPIGELRAFFGSPGGDLNENWSRFYKAYPESGGYMQVSAVGFDATKRRALVYVSHHCGSLCGGGSHHLLEKTEAGWQPAKVKDVKMCMWFS